MWIIYDFGDFFSFGSIELQKKLSDIEADNKTIREEFDVQRAKLKDLFLQKEGDSS